MIEGISPHINAINPNSYNNVKNKPISKEFQLDSKKNLSNDLITSKNGIEIARINEMRNFAVEFERLMLTTMWKQAHANIKDISEKDISDILYADQYIEEMVKAAYGDEGGPMAESITRKLIDEFKDRASDGGSYDLYDDTHKQNEPGKQTQAGG